MDSGTALVTGAARGIGRAVAIELARRGFDVVATMRNPTAVSFDDIGKLSGTIRTQRLDVTAPETISVPDDLCVVVNNAGVDGPYLPVEHASIDDWRRVFETNVFGVVAVTQAALSVMRPRRRGVVCNITSASIVFPMPLYAMYRASKAAVAALGESLAAEVAEFGIRVLEVQPGPIDTEMYAESAREPEANRYEEYRALSERTHQARLAVNVPAPIDTAAVAIADAIVDDASPLRVSCDPVGRSLRSGRDSMSDTDWFANTLKSFVPEK